MTLLKDAFKEKLMDVRLRDKLVHDGRITKDQVDAHLKSLKEEKYVGERDLSDGGAGGSAGGPSAR